ncbi:MAG: hypothetical protein GY765_33950, partial [bacterium]|nr:hypothetical protein [bacterium]
KYEYEKETIEKLAKSYRENLEKIIQHCRRKKESESTPSDLGYNRIPISSLRETAQKINSAAEENTKIEYIYPLTSMQRGLFTATLENREAYFVQLVFSLPARVDKEKFEESLNILGEKYEVFRTLYFNFTSPEPLQFVLAGRKQEMATENISHLKDDDKDAALTEIKHKDKSRGFDLSSDFSMRAIYLETDEKHDKFIWSFHNITLDGWSIGIFIKDFITIYEALVDGEPFTMESNYPYRDYVNWLVIQDLEEGMNYCRDYFAGYRSKPILNGLGNKIDAKKYELKEYTFTLDESLSDGLTRIASKSKTTLNVLCQTLWGVLLQKYTGENDVLFGGIVSGRSASVEGIEQMVGVFTNVIPVLIRSREDSVFSQLLKDTQDESINWKNYEHYPLLEILNDSSLSGDDIDNVVFFQNYQIEGERFVYTGEKKDGIKMRLAEYHEQLGHNFNLFVFPDRPLLFRFGFNSLVFDENFIKNLEENIKKVAKQITSNPDILVKDITID